MDEASTALAFARLINIDALVLASPHILSIVFVASSVTVNMVLVTKTIARLVPRYAVTVALPQVRKIRINTSAVTIDGPIWALISTGL